VSFWKSRPRFSESARNRFKTDITFGNMVTSFFASILYLSVVQLATAKIHHLFVGNLGLPASIYALEFDDQELTLVNKRNITADSSHAWIAFDVSFTSFQTFHCPWLTLATAQQEKCLWCITFRQTHLQLLSPSKLHTSTGCKFERYRCLFQPNICIRTSQLASSVFRLHGIMGRAEWLRNGHLDSSKWDAVKRDTVLEICEHVRDSWSRIWS